MVSQALLDEAYPIIARIAGIRSKNGAFAYYTNEDISQEVWSMCLDALDRYDRSVGPLENYLVKHVSNRLKNLKRDKYFRPGSDLATSGHAHVRISLVNALPLDAENADSGCVILGCSSAPVNPLERVICNESMEYLRKNLPSGLADYFDDIINGNKISKILMDEIQCKVVKLLEERGDDG